MCAPGPWAEPRLNPGEMTRATNGRAATEKGRRACVPVSPGRAGGLVRTGVGPVRPRARRRG